MSWKNGDAMEREVAVTEISAEEETEIDDEKTALWTVMAIAQEAVFAFSKEYNITTPVMITGLLNYAAVLALADVDGNPGRFMKAFMMCAAGTASLRAKGICPCEDCTKARAIAFGRGEKFKAELIKHGIGRSRQPEGASQGGTEDGRQEEGEPEREERCQESGQSLGRRRERGHVSAAREADRGIDIVQGVGRSDECAPGHLEGIHHSHEEDGES